MGMILDGVAASEAIDSSGEILDIEGCDISDLKNGVGVLNYEHRGDDAPGASANDIIGKIIFAKKIFNASDCDTERETEYWQKVKVPFIYIKAELFDDEGHPGAVSAAAVIRYYNTRGQPILARYSIEGSTLEKQGNTLKVSVAKRVALTIKPANKTAFSGVISDPKSKIDKLIEEDVSKFEHPERMKLGGTVEEGLGVGLFKDDITALREGLEAIKNLTKAQGVGGMGAAPGAITGYAALVPESAGMHGKVTKFDEEMEKKIKDNPRLASVFKTALRDWAGEGGGEVLKSLIKFHLRKDNLMEEVSEPYIDHFSRVADEWSIKKREGFLQKKEDKQMELVASKDPAPGEMPEFRQEGTGKRGASFNEKTGMLHTAKFSQKLYIPEGKLAQRYEQVLQDPHINEIHEKAMKNWVALHRQVREGKVPSELVKHAALFSACSPNTAVPYQELAFGFLQDKIDQGWDPTKALLPHEEQSFRDEFDKMAKGDFLPEYEKHLYKDMPAIYIQNAQNAFTPKGKYKEGWGAESLMHWEGPSVNEGEWDISQKQPGQRGDIGLSEQKVDGALAYNQLHGYLVKLLQQHGMDGRSISGQMMATKIQHRADQAGIARDVKGGKAPREAQAEASVKGFAPKTTRYLLGMFGLGNVHVPDTHFIRHVFGLQREDPRNRELKNVLWDARNEPVLAAIDRYYYQHHPAVAYTRERMKHQFGEDFGEQALFPAFWLHWLSIEPHERMRGWGSSATNAGTDHAVYFNALKRAMDRYGIPYSGQLTKNEESADKASLEAHCAHVMYEMEERFGHPAAMLAYYAYLVPAMTGTTQTVLKAEALKALLLKKSDSDHNESVEFRGQKVKPGVIQIRGTGSDRNNATFGAHKLLHVDGKNHYVEMANGKRVAISNREIQGAPSYYKIDALPEGSKYTMVVDSAKHSVPGGAKHPEQKEVIHGIDLSKPTHQLTATEKDNPDSFFMTKGMSGSYKNAKGDIVWVKPEIDYLGDFGQSRREAAFYHLAKWMGLGQYVPPTGAFRHPVNKTGWSGQAMMPNAEHWEGTENQQTTLRHLGLSGELDKMALMDLILHNTDRHVGNYIFSGNNMYLIDHGYTFPDRAGAVMPRHMPDYWIKYHDIQYPPTKSGSILDQTQLHPEAVRWLKSLDPKAFENEMLGLGVPPLTAKESAQRLELLRERMGHGNLNKKAVWYYPEIARGGNP